MSSTTDNILQFPSDRGSCSFCDQESGPTRKLVRSPTGHALICRRCAESIISTLSENPQKDRRDILVGACCFVSMILLGVVLVYHYLMATNEHRVIGYVAAGALLLMGVMPIYVINFRGGRL